MLRRDSKAPAIILFVRGHRKTEDLEALAQRVSRQIDELGVAAVDDNVVGVVGVGCNAKGNGRPKG